jgi:hypothetical protein
MNAANRFTLGADADSRQAAHVPTVLPGNSGIYFQIANGTEEDRIQAIPHTLNAGRSTDEALLDY